MTGGKERKNTQKATKKKKEKTKILRCNQTITACPAFVLAAAAFILLCAQRDGTTQKRTVEWCTFVVVAVVVVYGVLFCTDGVSYANV